MAVDDVGTAIAGRRQRLFGSSGQPEGMMPRGVHTTSDPSAPGAPADPTSGGAATTPAGLTQTATMAAPHTPVAELPPPPAPVTQPAPAPHTSVEQATANPTSQPSGIQPRALLDESVSGRLKDIVDENGPLMQQAARAGLNTANRRGLINSSIAAGAAQSEVIRQAAPLAQQEAAQASQRNLQTLGNQDQLEQLERQIASTEGQQKLDLIAQKERLIMAGQQEQERLASAAGYDQQRAYLQAQIDSAMQTSGAQQAQQLTKLQGVIQSALQTQVDASTMQRLQAQFAQDFETQQRANGFALQQIAAQGDEALRNTLAQADAAMRQLSMSIASNDRGKIAELSTQIFGYQAQIRASLLGNTEMKSSEREKYEKAISSLGDPVQNYLNELYKQAGTPAPTTATAPTGIMPLGLGGISA